jgi:hypothetical protein
VPKGTHGIYTGDNFNIMNEKEVLLDRGLKYKVNNKKYIDESGYENGTYVHKSPYIYYEIEVIQ